MLKMMGILGRLLSRVVNCSDRCVHCKNTCENEWHIFFGCSKLHEAWSATGLVLQGLLNVVDGFIMPFFLSKFWS